MTDELQRDKEQTMGKLLDAFDRVLIEEGFQKLGINKVAQMAGVSKVLIYRYFQNFDGLLAAYLERKAFWLTKDRPMNADELRNTSIRDLKAGAIEVFHNLYDDLVQHIEQQEIRRWELMAYNEVLFQIGQRIEESVAERNRTMAEVLGIGEKEFTGVISILVGGIYYLVLRAKTIDRFNDIPLRTPEGHQTIKDAIAFIINHLDIK